MLAPPLSRRAAVTPAPLSRVAELREERKSQTNTEEEDKEISSGAHTASTRRGVFMLADDRKRAAFPIYLLPLQSKIRTDDFVLLT
jgi:hypothetical protein